MAFASPKQLLDRFGLSPKHSFGQNFLSDPNLTAKIAVLAAEPGPEVVLELGAGLGALTSELLSRVPRVVAVERDRDLVPCLTELFSSEVAEGRLEVVEADAKTADWEGLLGTGEPRVLTGNLPYQITGPLLQRTVELAPLLSRAVFLVQKEVADRLSAAHDTENYGALSVFVQAAFSVRRAFIIKSGAFHPAPRVDSAVVVLDRKAERVAETQTFRRFVKAAFAGRRKTLRNAWRSIGDEAVEAAAEAAGISLDQRGETLSVAEFDRVAKEFDRLVRGPSSGEEPGT